MVFLIKSEMAGSFDRSSNGKPQSSPLKDELVSSLRAQAVSADLWPRYHLKVEVFNEQLDANSQHPGEWTILNILPQFTVMNRTNTITSAGSEAKSHVINERTRWIIICEETTSVNASVLLQHLALHDYKQVFIGTIVAI